MTMTKKMLLGLPEEKQRDILNDYVQTNSYEKYLYEMSELPEMFETVADLMGSIDKVTFDFGRKYFYTDDFGRVHATNDLYDAIDPDDVVGWINREGDE